MVQSNKTEGFPKYGNDLLNNNGKNYRDIENLNSLNANFWLQMLIEVLQYANLSSTISQLTPKVPPIICSRQLQILPLFQK